MLIDQVQVVRPLENLSTISDLSLLKKHFYGTPILNSILVNGKELDCLIALNDNKLQGDKDLQRMYQRNISCFEHICNKWLNTGHYSNIPDHFRLLYAFVCALRAKFEALCGNNLASLYACDEGLLKGNDLEDGSLSKFASIICREHLQNLPEIDEKLKIEPIWPLLLPNSMKIPAIELPSLDQFYREFFCPQLPLIIRGMINGWPAFEKWSRMSEKFSKIV